MITKQIILASSSPRRIEILKTKGINPLIIPPEVDETISDDMKPHDAVMFLALKKALCVESIAIEKNYDDSIIIAADTVVVFDEKIIGKPIDKEDAFAILKTLCGNMHTVLTGVAIITPNTTKREVFYESTKVFFKSYTNEDIFDYINTPEPYDKAGSYAIQGDWGKHIDHILGDYNNVVGFPWDSIEKRLQKLL